MKPDWMLRPEWPELPPQIGAFSTLRHGGASTGPFGDGVGGGGLNLASHVEDSLEHVLHNREVIGQSLPASPLWLEQVHGIDVMDLDASESDSRADACITTRSGVVCAIQTADCLPVLLCDAHNLVVGAAHAGWRGLVKGVLENTVAAMLGRGARLETLSAWLGPAIGSQRFEVGAEVRQQFVDAEPAAAAAFAPHPELADQFYADLYALARQRLQAAGIVTIRGGGFCTVSAPAQFYSYRRDGLTGRMASLIWIKEKK